jgi:Epoxide hydrolase N terminus
VPVRPFTVHVPDATLADLRERLGRTRWPGELDGPGWQDGTSPAFMRELLEWWRTGFDWRAQEAAINRYPHFRATVDGVGLHFLHLRGPRPGAGAAADRPGGRQRSLHGRYERFPFPPRYWAPASGADVATLGPRGMKLKNSGSRC